LCLLGRVTDKKSGAIITRPAFDFEDLAISRAILGLDHGFSHLNQYSE